MDSDDAMVMSQIQAEAVAQRQQRAPQVSEALTRMDACLEDLESAMSALAARIDPVLRPDTAAKSGHSNAPVPVRCPIANEIDHDADAVCRLTAALRDLLDRLEV